MKKLLALILSIIMVLTLVSCGKTTTDAEVETPEAPEINETVETPEEDATEKPEAKPDNKKEENKKEEVKVEKEEPKPSENNKEESKEETPKTVAQTLLADLKSKAGSHSSATSLAEALSTNPIIPFMAGAMPVEPGLLSGFGNTEIKGFKDGAMFAPFIGSIPFIGYVFILEDGVSASSFISTLESNADLRWNICVEADEKLSGSVGNKVFFVMSPKSFDEE